ncbi:hypothetical protein AM588_10008347 [Phytophthora nicotianae]|uniref:Uncharacterized protein n=1 Tax=Phytophthora nicotianae TaxID=4792 RepID=A0A0W8DS42_PHYNI|nr:hypothetical protein AM588_10008347 [Phytophthora nicotianae]
MTSDPELNAEVVDGETVKSPEGVIIGKLPRDFRIRKFVEMTRLSYDELDAMAFLEAVNHGNSISVDHARSFIMDEKIPDDYTRPKSTVGVVELSARAASLKAQSLV